MPMGQQDGIPALEDTWAQPAAPSDATALLACRDEACVQVADRAAGLQLPHVQDKARGPFGKGVRSGSWYPGYFGLIIAGCALFEAVMWSSGESSQG